MSDIGIQFRTEAAKKIEREIHPPMALAATIPIEVETVDLGWDHRSKPRRKIEGIALYIVAGAFAPPVSEAEFRKIVEAVVEQLEAREG